MPSKAKAKDGTLVLPLVQDRPGMIDEFCALGMRLDAVRPMQERYEELRREIAGWHMDSDATETYTETGAAYAVKVGPRALRRRIVSLPDVAHRIGIQRFLEVCTLSLEKLDTVILPREQEGIVVTERTGPRVVTPLGPVSKAAIA